MLYIYYIDYPDEVKYKELQRQTGRMVDLFQEEMKTNADICLGQVFQSAQAFEDSINSSTGVNLSDIDFMIKDVYSQYDDEGVARTIVVDVSFIESGKLYNKLQNYIRNCSILPAIDTKKDKIICFGLILPRYVKL
jgi:hypothetical protein